MEIAIPDLVPQVNDGKILCYGEVVRVEEPKKSAKVGVACRIDTYKFEFPHLASKARVRRPRRITQV